MTRIQMQKLLDLMPTSFTLESIEVKGSLIWAYFKTSTGYTSKFVIHRNNDEDEWCQACHLDK